MRVARLFALMQRLMYTGRREGAHLEWLSSLAWMSQSPPFMAFLKKWIPIPPSSFLCLMHSPSMSRHGEHGTSFSKQSLMKAHLFSRA